MKRLTERNKNGLAMAACCGKACEYNYVCEVGGFGECRGMDDIIDRLADIEDILGDDYDLGHLRELVETARQAWASVNEQMPDEHDSIFKKLIAKEKWGAGMFERLSDDVIVAVKFADGTRRSGFAHTKDGVWMGLPSIGCPVVTHWMPLPSLPEEE